MSLITRIQYFLPHRALSTVARMLAYSKISWLKSTLIHLAIKKFGIDMNEAADSNPDHYPSFNAFFTRALRPEARPVNPDSSTLLMPADGSISQSGRIEKGRIFQAKGHSFTVAELLGDETVAAPFINGQFATIYLSPRDYHRVHMPWTGTLIETLHIPGRLFSVGPSSVSTVPRVFARNERLVCHFQTDFGRMCLVMVGAMLVSGIETVWNGVNVPAYASQPVRKRFRNNHSVQIERFAEMARFNYGSTVIILLPKDRVVLDELSSEQPVRLGQRMGKIILNNEN